MEYGAADLPWGAALGRPENGGGSACRRELREVPSTGDERQIARLRRMDRRHAHDLQIAVAFEATLQLIRDVP
jgi:hypothetical protein